jgi:hypothetical protein
MDTIDALAALDAEFDMRSAAGRVWDEGNAVQLTMTFANSLPQREQLARLLRDYGRAVDAAAKGAHPRRGSMLYVLWLLFGGAQASRHRQSISCERGDLVATLDLKSAQEAQITWTRS